MSDHTPTVRHSPNGHTLDAALSALHTVATPSWVCTSAAPLQAAISGLGQDHIGPATALWPTGQDSDAAQRAGRYPTQTQRHPRRTRPAVAATAIGRYSRPGQTVFDPFTGSGTTMVEAAYSGRHAIGVDIDPRWLEQAELNLRHARRRGATGRGVILRGDARHLPPTPRRLRGSVDLVVTTPPTRLHPHRHPTRRSDDADLIGQLATDLKLSLTSWIPLLHPGTVIVLTTRLVNRGDRLLDLTPPLAYAARRAGLDLVERVAALRVPIRDANLRPRRITRTRRRAPRPQVIHDDVLVYRVPDVPPTWWRGRR